MRLLLILLHVYVGWRLLGGLHTGPAGAAAAAAVVVALTLSVIGVPLAFRARRMRSRGLADAITWVGMIAGSLFSSLLVLTFLRDVILLVVRLAAPSGLSQLTGASAATVVVLALAATLVGLINARRRARIVEVDVPLPNLPAALHGFSIAQISDVHVGPTIKRGYVDAIVDAVNELEADLIAVTGDLVDGSVAHLREETRPLARLAAREGTFFVTGNHEYYSGAHEWTRELRELGINVLMNEHVVLRRGDAALVIAGVTDYSAHHHDPAQRSDPAAALLGAPVDAAARILLAHQPMTAPAAAAAGFDLQISGHTHGGQFWPWTWVVRYYQPFTAGLHSLNRLLVYVSRGTGYWGPPTRLGAPSEITRLRLVTTAPV